MKVKLLVVIFLLLLPVYAFSQDMLLTAKIEDVAVALDKNGKQYVRLIVNEKRTLEGIAYEVGVPVMAFGSQVKEAKTLKKGEILKAICDKREKDGRTSYIILKIIR